jgi:hypothetical protein
LVDGPGTVQLNNIQNPFTGGITLGGTGILSLGHANSAGIGASKITFQSGAAATLQFSAGNAPSEAITGFEAGDTIELLGSSATYSLSDTFTYTAATKTLVVKTGAGAVLASPASICPMSAGRRHCSPPPPATPKARTSKRPTVPSPSRRCSPAWSY